MRQRTCPILTLAGLGLLLASPAASAGVMQSQWTGNVEVDFPNTPENGVVTIVDNPNAEGQASPLDVAQDASLPGVSGWNIKDLRLAYDDATDVMHFGLNFFGIAGDADGDGNPGHLSGTIGRDTPSLGGLESIVVAIDTNLDGVPEVLAGVPSMKPAGSGVDAFTVAAFKDSPAGLAFSFGDAMPDHAGTLAFDPSAEHPDFEFSIANFKALQGLVPEDGFIVSAFAGTPDDVVAGEEYVSKTRIAFPDSGNQNVPEPAAVLGWALVAGGALAYRVRLRRRRDG